MSRSWSPLDSVKDHSYRAPAPGARGVNLPPHQPDDDAHQQPGALAPGEIAIGRPAERDHHAAALHHLEGIDGECAAERVVDDIVIAILLKIVFAVVGNDAVGPERSDEIRVFRTRRRRHVKAEMLCVLNRERADTAGAGMDQDPLPGLRTGTPEHPAPWSARRAAAKPLPRVRLTPA